MLCTTQLFLFCFFKQKTAYDMRISDWSSDVCSSDLRMCCRHDGTGAHRSAPASIAEAPCSASLAPTRMNPNSSRPVPLPAIGGAAGARPSKTIGASQIGRAACRERVCQYVEIWGVAVPLKKKKLTNTEESQTP